MTNVDRLRRAYQRWHDSRGADPAGWLALVGEDTAAASLADGAPGMEFTAARRGPGEFKEYFAGLARDWEMLSFVADEFIAEGDRVAVFGRCAWRHRRTGKDVESPFAHFWRFRDGTVTECFEFFDTAKTFAAARPD